MISKISSWKILVQLRWTVLLLVLGLVSIGLISAQADDLTGVWITDIGEYTQVGNLLEMTFNNGNFEFTLDGTLLTRGTYTARNGRYTTQITDVYGGAFDSNVGLESRWYSQEQLRIALRPIFTIFMSVADFNIMINEMFSTETGTYSISGNILTMKIDGETESFTYRRN